MADKSLLQYKRTPLKGEDARLDVFTETLDPHRSGQSLARILAVWDLSQADAARLLGVSHQAVGKWLEGAPHVESPR